MGSAPLIVARMACSRLGIRVLRAATCLRIWVLASTNRWFVRLPDRLRRPIAKA